MKNRDNVTDSRRGALLWAALGVVGFSGTLPATRLAVPHLGALYVGLGRTVLAAACGAVLLVVTRARFPSAHQWLRLGVVSLGVVIGFPLLSAWALLYTTAGRAAVIIALVPLLTAVVSSLRERTFPSRPFWAASLMGTCCVLWFFSGGAREGTGTPAPLIGGVSWAPEIALLLAAGCAAVGYTEGARLTRELGGLRVISWALLLALPFVLPLLWTQEWPESKAPLSAWAGFGYVSLVSMFFAYYFWYGGLARGGVAGTSQVQLLQPLLTVGWAVLLLGEALSWRLLLCGVGVLVAVFLSWRCTKSTEHPPGRDPHPGSRRPVASAPDQRDPARPQHGEDAPSHPLRAVSGEPQKKPMLRGLSIKLPSVFGLRAKRWRC